MAKTKTVSLAVWVILSAGALALPAADAALDPNCIEALGCKPSPTQSAAPPQNPQPTPTPTQTTGTKKDDGGSQPPPATDSSGGGAPPAPPPPPAAPAPPGAPAAPPPPPPPGAPAPLPPPPGSSFPLQVPVFNRTPSRTTARLIEILQPAVDHGAIKPEDLRKHFAPFPIAGLAYFSDDWGFPRYTPTPHLHEGTDVFADEGTPVIAYGPGTVKGVGNQAVGGLSVWVHYDDGNVLYYTHLSAFAPGLAVGQRVEMGTDLASVGNSGNASGGAHHVHLEIHPPVRSKDRIVSAGATTLPNGQASSNTAPVNPKPYLDSWLAQAEERARAYVDGLLKQYAEIPREAHISRRVNDLFSLDSVERPVDLLWFSAAQPELGILGLARQAAGEARLTSAVGSIAQRTREQQRLAAVHQAVQAPLYKMATLTGLPFFDYGASGGPS